VQQRSNVDSAVVQNVQEVNGLTAQIATLNGQIATATGLAQDTNALQDQRGQLLNQLSNLIDISTIPGNNSSLTVTTGNGAALVVDSTSTPLSTQMGANGVNHIFSGPQDITSNISGGQLAGLIDARDNGIPGLQQQLDSMTQSFVTAFNTQHQAGYDLNGAAGGAFFTIGNSSQPAATVSVAVTDPSKVAASSDATTGNNGNALALRNLQTQAISGNQSVMDMYTGAVSTLGNEVSKATNEQQAGKLVLTQIQNQRSSYSGVNLDEESVNMTRYQQAYQAAAQVLSVINSLTSTTIDMIKS
jgi:flagellar hook-associated protein 1 FlgK